MNTKKFNFHKLIVQAIFCLILLALPFGSQQPAAAKNLAAADGTAPTNSAGEAGYQPLAGLLNPDGTLKLDAGFNASPDLLGWNLQFDPSGLPRLLQSNLTVDGGFYESVGLDGIVLDIKTYGNEVYVGGNFNYHSQGLDNGILLARWTYAGGWETLLRCADDRILDDLVRTLAVDENYVYVGGYFRISGGDGAYINNIARWRRSTGQWSAMGQGLVGWVGGQPVVNAILPDGYGNAYVGGKFSQALPGAPEANGLVIWDNANAQWWSLAQSVNGLVYDLALKNGKLYVVGNFTQAGGGAPYYPISANQVAMWDGTWHALGSGLPVNDYGLVYSIDADANGRVYAGGRLWPASAPSQGVLQWDPATGVWSPLGEGLTGWGGGTPGVRDIYVAGNGVVFAGGDFAQAGRTAPEANNLAKFDQGNWYSLAQSMPSSDQWIDAITAGSDGYLYAVGNFEAAGGPIPTAASNIARFDGANWWALSGWVK